MSARLTSCPEWRRELKRLEVANDRNHYPPQAVRFEPRDAAAAPAIERCPFVTHWRGGKAATVCGLPAGPSAGGRGHYCATHAEVMYASPRAFAPKTLKADDVPRRFYRDRKRA